MTPPEVAARGAALLGSSIRLVASHRAAPSSTAANVSVGHALLQMVVALGLVIGGIWAFGKLVRRPRRRGIGAGSTRRDAPLTIVSRQSLGKGLSLAAVKWGDQEVLVGIAGSTITFLDDPRNRPPALPADGPADGDRDAGPPVPVAFGGAPATYRPALSRSSWLESLRQATVRR